MQYLDDTGCSLTVAIASAVCSKNSLANIYGFSPNQLVFGKNPNLPTNINNKLPALESPTTSKVISERLSAMHSAREAFVKANTIQYNNTIIIFSHYLQATIFQKKRYNNE